MLVGVANEEPGGVDRDEALTTPKVLAAEVENAAITASILPTVRMLIVVEGLYVRTRLRALLLMATASMTATALARRKECRITENSATAAEERKGNRGEHRSELGRWGRRLAEY